MIGQSFTQAVVATVSYPLGVCQTEGYLLRHWEICPNSVFPQSISPQSDRLLGPVGSLPPVILKSP
jgi:hypothetical protein